MLTGYKGNTTGPRRGFMPAAVEKVLGRWGVFFLSVIAHGLLVYTLANALTALVYDSDSDSAAVSPGGAEIGMTRMTGHCGADGSGCKAFDCYFSGQRVQDRAIFEALGGVVLADARRPQDCTWGIEGNNCVCVAPNAMFGPDAGFSVEIGGHDGIFISNTIFFDKVLGWNGMLVEGNPETFPLMVKNRPRAISVHALIDAGSADGPKSLPYYSFQVGEKDGRSGGWESMMSGVEGGDGPLASRAAAEKWAAANNVKLSVSQVQLKSFRELFLENGIDKITFFSIDVEGHELSVLRSIDFDAVEIGLILIEKGRSDYPGILVENGFTDVSWILSSDTTDYLFANCSPRGPDCPNCSPNSHVLSAAALDIICKPNPRAS